MSTSSKTFVVAGKEIMEDDDYITYVDGVGPIPRDIYKHVKSDPLGDLSRYSVHIVIQHLLIFITFMFCLSYCYHRRRYPGQNFYGQVRLSAYHHPQI